MSHPTQSNSTESVRIDGLMTRADHEMILWLLLAAGVFAAFVIPPLSLMSWALYIAIALGIARFAFGERAGLKEAVIIHPTDAGLELLRRGGRNRHLGAWRLFESATIQQLPARNPFHGLGRWRLTISNACIPSIGSFLHTRASEQIVFHFPIIITFEASAMMADRLMEQLRSRIKIAQQQPSKKPVRYEPFDPAALLKLHECMACAYPLRGLQGNGACPECGWQFDEQMFVAEGQSARPSWNMGFPIGLAGIFTLVSLMTGSPFVLLIFLLVFGMAMGLLIATRIAEKRPLRARVLVTSVGVELWRGTMYASAHRWEELCELRSVWTQMGRYRLAAWNQPKQRVKYSSFFERWSSDPPGAIVFDLMLAGNRDAAEVVRAEIERRWTTARRPHPPTQPARLPRDGVQLTKINSYQPW